MLLRLGTGSVNRITAFIVYGTVTEKNGRCNNIVCFLSPERSMMMRVVCTTVQLFVRTLRYSLHNIIIRARFNFYGHVMWATRYNVFCERKPSPVGSHHSVFFFFFNACGLRFFAVYYFLASPRPRPTCHRPKSVAKRAPPIWNHTEILLFPP